MKAAQSGQALRPFESQIPGSNPGRSIGNLNNFSHNLTECKDKLQNIESKSANSTYIGSQVYSDEGNSLSSKKEILLKSVRCRYDDTFWKDFKNYLVRNGQRHHSVRNKVGYAKRFYYILETKDAHDVQILSHGSKVHTMKALASLSKFLGKYNLWLEIAKIFQLKWSNSTKSIQVFKEILGVNNTKNSLDTMLNWIKDVSRILTKDYQHILLFNTLTGLRPEEAQKAIWLIKTKHEDYIDQNNQILKHYLYPETFQRQTKNAFISIINEDILKIAKETPERQYYYPSLRKRISITNDFEMNMYYCRKVFATFLRNKGIEPEIIDLLQGRLSQSIFLRHYYRPDIDDTITKKIRPVLDSLNCEITGYDLMPII